MKLRTRIRYFNVQESNAQIKNCGVISYPNERNSYLTDYPELRGVTKRIGLQMIGLESLD